MSILSDILTAREIWARLTRAQREALLHPWRQIHPKVQSNLGDLGLWDGRGATREGLAVALVEYQYRDQAEKRRHSP